MIAACLNHHRTAAHTETLNQKLNLANLSCGLKTISDSCPGWLSAQKSLWHWSRLSFMATIADVPAEPGSHHSSDRGRLWERAVWQSCVVESPALSIMEQLFGALCARALEHRVNRGEEQCKQRWDGGSWFPATVKGGKHPRELDGGVVDTGLHKQHYTERLGKGGEWHIVKGKKVMLYSCVSSHTVPYLYIFIVMGQIIPRVNIRIISFIFQILILGG